MAHLHRVRFLLVTTAMLLALLGVSQARADETVGAPLELEVTASRALCTAGSVTDVA